MKTLSIIMAAAVLSLGSAHARIGETEAQIEQRFGKPKQRVFGKTEVSVQRHYVANGYNILVTFIGGVSQEETYSKVNKALLSESEIQILLQANAAGSEWVADPVAKQAGCRAGWKLASAEGTAMWTPDGRALGVWSAIGERIKKDAAAKVSEAKLKDF